MIVIDACLVASTGRRIGRGGECHQNNRSEQGSEAGSMGSVCSCLLAGDTEEYRRSNALNSRNCICLGCLAQQLMSVYTALFRREDMHAVPSSLQERVALASPALTMDDSVPDTYHSPPRPIPYDDPRFTQHDGLISRNEKFLSHFHQESEPLRSNTNSETESKMKGKCKSNYDGGSKLCQPESSLKHFSAEARKEVTYIFPSSEDEDVCPTCLEEYTSEDPKITMQCSHHFHLGCIYEWMERSDACPVCGKGINSS
ncbi:E3 ubiquitin-protein ligase At3g02290-like isoform X2 [Musa acuminata AAA Group]|uniref:E3 ubiquitin-protein ligase At3g02290-like isoform X2 n=2 Tax=Musa acuminata AAA Group TaxID=214697 RepID=UPI0031DC10E6